MSDHDFVFALDLSDEAYFDRLLTALAAAVLRHVGYDASTIDRMTDDVRTALHGGAADPSRRCTVRFRAGGGTLYIGIAYAGGQAWETTRTLPAGS